jgi:hypothetical protein
VTKWLRKRLFLVSLVSFALAITFYSYVKAEESERHQVVISKKTVYYTPGQLNNCKWVVHTSSDLTTFPGDVTSIQIGIPEAAGHGYIEGVLENGPNQTLLLAFKLPGTTKKSPPIILTSEYGDKELPLKSLRFKVFSSSIMTMMLYSTYEKCVEATME